MKTCPFCGSPVEENDVFCNQCGKSLVRNCPNCGEQIEIHAAFCRECGFELNPAAPAEKAAVPVPVYKKWWFWLVAAAAVIGLILLFSSGGSRGSSAPAEEPEETVSTGISATQEPEDPASEPSQETVEEATDSQLPAPAPVPASGIRDKAKAQEITDFQETVDKAIEKAFPEDTEGSGSGKTETMDIKTFRKTMEEVLEEAFGKGHFETELDQEEKRFNVYVWMDGATDALKTAQTGDEEDIAYWNARVGVLILACKTVKEKLDRAGLSDWSVTLSLLDEKTHENIYAITKDGFIYYEILKDGELET